MARPATHALSPVGRAYGACLDPQSRRLFELDCRGSEAPLRARACECGQQDVRRCHIIGQPYPAFSLVRLLAKAAANASHVIFYKSIVHRAITALPAAL